MSANSVSAARNEAIDVAKGLCIALVVLQHVCGAVPLTGWTPLVQSFHMSLFFALSGVCFDPKRHSDLARHVRRRVEQLLIPAVLFYVLVSLPVEFALGGLDRLMAALALIKVSCINWFLVALFAADVAYAFLHKALHADRLLLAAVAAAALLCGLLLEFFHAPNLFDYKPIPTAFACFACGNLLREPILRLTRLHCPGRLLFLSVSLYVLWAFCTLRYGHTFAFVSGSIEPSDLLGVAFGSAATLAFATASTNVNGGGGGGSVRTKLLGHLPAARHTHVPVRTLLRGDNRQQMALPFSYAAERGSGNGGGRVGDQPMVSVALGQEEAVGVTAEGLMLLRLLPR